MVKKFLELSLILMIIGVGACAGPDPSLESSFYTEKDAAWCQKNRNCAFLNCRCYEENYTCKCN